MEAAGGGDGAEKQTYGFQQVSLFQLSSVESSSAQGAIKVLRRLAFAQKSSSLAQLAQRVESAVRIGGPFSKAEGLTRT